MSTGYLTTLAAVAEIAAARDPRVAERVRVAIATLARTPEARRDRVAAAMRVLDPRLTCLPELTRGAVLCEAYPLAPIELQARLILGETPAQISGGLTAREAHGWLMTVRIPFGSPAEWLLRGSGQAGHVASVAVARWVLAVRADPERLTALEMRRLERGPHGEEIAGAYADRVDELRDVDLRPSIRETFARATARLLRGVERAMRKPGLALAAAPIWWRSIRCATLLLTSAQLAAEGRIMRHCVAMYVPYVRRGDSVIVAIDVRGQRSTVEIDRASLTVRQHKGIGNADPPELCIRALFVCLRRWSGDGALLLAQR